MLYVVGIAVVILLVVFVAIPLIKALIKLLGNFLALALGVAGIILAIWLCIIFPPFLIIFVGIGIYQWSKS